MQSHKGGVSVDPYDQNNLMRIEGSKNLTFACTDFRARKLVRRARSCTQN